MTEHKEVHPEILIENNQPKPSGDAFFIPLSILVGSLIIAGSLFYSNKLLVDKIDKLAAPVAAPAQQQAQAQGQAAPPAQAGAPVDIKLTDNSAYLGKSDAKVTVVEYADYQCPFCEKFYTTVMPDLKSKYIETGKIKFYYQDFAFLGADSNTAGEAAHCALDQNKFWQFHDYLFSHQGQENSGWATVDKLKIMAQNVGLNSGQFSQCMSSGKYKQAVLDETSAGRSYGVTGTPTVFVNGVAIVGAQPFSAFQQAIDAALAK